jgi:putative redox protein
MTRCRGTRLLWLDPTPARIVGQAMTIKCETEQPGAFRQILRAEAHTFRSDLAATAGGQDSAPGPHDYFDASLAACKALTAHVYAKGHGIALDRVDVHVERDNSRERQGTYVLKVKLEFYGALTDAEKAKLHDVVSRCPIHKLMTSTKVEVLSEPP